MTVAESTAGRDVGDALVADPGVDKIIFSGRICFGLTRGLVPESRHDEVVDVHRPAGLPRPSGRRRHGAWPKDRRT